MENLNPLIQAFLNTLIDRSVIATPLVAAADIAIVPMSTNSFLLLSYGNKYPILLHPNFLPELKATVQTARDILEIDLIRIDFEPDRTVLIYCKGDRFYQEVSNGLT